MESMIWTCIKRFPCLFWTFYRNLKSIKNFLKNTPTISRKMRCLYSRGPKKPSYPLWTLKSEYPDHWLHKSGLAATHGASASTLWSLWMIPYSHPERHSMGCQRGGVEPHLCDERASHNDTHRCDTLKESAVLPTMWYRKRELFPAAGPVVCPRMSGK